jgi:hypothetical protein
MASADRHALQITDWLPNYSWSLWVLPANIALCDSSPSSFSGDVVAGASVRSFSSFDEKCG